MKDINNMLNHLTYNQKAVTKWFLINLKKNKSITFTTEQVAKETFTTTPIVLCTIKLIATSEAIKFGIKKKNATEAKVYLKGTFNALVKALEV